MLYEVSFPVFILNYKTRIKTMSSETKLSLLAKSEEILAEVIVSKLFLVYLQFLLKIIGRDHCENLLVSIENWNTGAGRD